MSPWSAASAPAACPGRSRPPASACHPPQARRSSTRGSIASLVSAHAPGADRPRPDLPLHREHVGTAGGGPRGHPDHRHLGAERRHVGGALQAGLGRSARPLDPPHHRQLAGRQGLPGPEGPRAATSRTSIYNGVDPEPLRGARHAGRDDGRSSASPRITRWSASSPGWSRRRTPAHSCRPRRIVAERLPNVSFLVIGGGSLQPGPRARGAGARARRAHGLHGPPAGRAADARRLRPLGHVLGEGGHVEHDHGVDGRGQADGRHSGGRQCRADRRRRDRLPRAAREIPPRSRTPCSGSSKIRGMAKSMGHQASARIAGASPWRPWCRRPSSSTTTLVEGPASSARRSAASVTRRRRTAASPSWRLSSRATWTPTSSARSRASPPAAFRFRIFSLRATSTARWCTRRPVLCWRDTVYAPFLASWPLLSANARFASHAPRPLLRGAPGPLQRRPRRRPRALVRTLAVFPKSRVLRGANRRREGIRHIHANWASHPAMSAWVMSRLTGRLLELRRTCLGHLSRPNHAAREDPGGEVRRRPARGTTRTTSAGVGGQGAAAQDRPELPRRGPRSVQARAEEGRRRRSAS